MTGGARDATPRGLANGRAAGYPISMHPAKPTPRAVALAAHAVPAPVTWAALAALALAAVTLLAR
jgi:hypothetical protein